MSEFENLKYPGFHVHKHDLGSHILRVHFKKIRPVHNGSGDNHWSTSFSMEKKGEEDQSFGRRNVSKISSEVRHKAISRVVQSISHFIKKSKPGTLEMNGNTQGKKKVYSKFANRVAQQHNGRIIRVPSDGEHFSGTTDRSVVEFPRHKE